MNEKEQALKVLVREAYEESQEVPARGFLSEDDDWPEKPKLDTLIGLFEISDALEVLNNMLNKEENK